MAKNGQVDWYGDDVLLRIANGTQSGMNKLAQMIVDQAKDNAIGNEQFDTGFMVNSGYIATPDQSTYGDEASGIKLNPEVDHPSGSDPWAVAAFAAEYSLIQELRIPFLYPALEQVTGDADGVLIEHVKKAE